MKKPLIVWLAQAALVLVILSNGLLAQSSVVALFKSDASPARGTGGLVVGALVGALAVWLLVRTLAQQTTRRRVVLFFWSVLVLYPVMNILRGAGYFPLGPELRPEELAGAAAVELSRYALLLVLIVWLSCSKAAAQFLSARRIAATAGAGGADA